MDKYLRLLGNYKQLRAMAGSSEHNNNYTGNTYAQHSTRVPRHSQVPTPDFQSGFKKWKKPGFPLKIPTSHRLAGARAWFINVCTVFEPGRINIFQNNIMGSNKI